MLPDRESRMNIAHYKSIAEDEDHITITLFRTQFLDIIHAYEAMQREIERLKNLRFFKQTRLHTDEQHGNCFATCLATLLGYNGIEDVPQWETGEDWGDYYQRYMSFLTKKGFTILRMEGHPHIQGFYIASGFTARGTKHACIYHNGHLLHDPHPSGEGLEVVEFVEVLGDIEFVVDKYRTALEEYGVHDDYCDIMYRLDATCSCGLSKFLETK